MKLNVSFPATGCQKLFEFDDEKKTRIFHEKRMGQEVDGDSLGDEWKGYVFRIAGGNDKQGFPMKQGVLTNNRVRLLLSKGHSCYRPRRTGERKRKSVRGCIVDSNLSVLALIIVKKGDGEIPGLTDTSVPRRLGPKRASKIRKLFNLNKLDDVRQYVIKRPLPVKEGKKPRHKAPKIQRLVTPVVLQRKKHKMALKRQRNTKNKEEKAEYAKLLAVRHKEAREKRQAEIKRRRSSMRDSKTSEKSEKKEKVEKMETDEKPEKKVEKKVEKKTEKKPEKKTDKKPEKKTDKKPEKKTDKKPEKKTDKKPEKKTEQKTEKKAEKKTVKKTDKKPEKKSGAKSGAKSDKKPEKKSGAKKPETKGKKKKPQPDAAEVPT